MILLWGAATDPPLAAVYAALSRRSAPVALIDVDSAACSVQLTVDPEVRGSLCVDGAAIDLAAVNGLYLRPAVPATGADEALWAFSEITPAIVLNRPAAMAGNGSKPYQAVQARAVGFATPDTLITTSVDAARDFASGHGEVIYKSTSGVRSVVAVLDVADNDSVVAAVQQWERDLGGLEKHHRVAARDDGVGGAQERGREEPRGRFPRSAIHQPHPHQRRIQDSRNDRNSASTRRERSWYSSMVDSPGVGLNR